MALSGAFRSLIPRSPLVTPALTPLNSILQSWLPSDSIRFTYWGDLDLNPFYGVPFLADLLLYLWV